MGASGGLLIGRLYNSFLVRAFFSSASSGSVSKVAMLVTTLMTVRALRPEDFGIYAGLLGTALLASFSWDLGVSPVLARELAADSVSLQVALIRCMLLRLYTFPVWLGVFSGGAWMLERRVTVPITAMAGFAAGSLLYGISMLLYGALRGSLQFGFAEMSVATGRILTAMLSLCALPVVGLFHGLNFLAIAVGAGEFATLLIATFFVFSSRTPIARPPTNGVSERITLRKALPFAANGIMVLAYNRFDVVIVAALSSSRQLALYAPASRIQDALQLIPGSILTIGLPIFAQASKRSDGKTQVQAIIGSLTWGGLLITIPVSVAAFFSTSWLLTTVMGPGYAEAVTPTRILICSLPFNALLVPMISALAGTGHTVDTTKVVAITTVVAMMGHLSLDWWLGATGGAIASLLRDPAGATVALALARRNGLVNLSILQCPLRKLGALPSLND
jgi:O-antigen/teichoic acid export membrane protein